MMKYCLLLLFAFVTLTSCNRTVGSGKLITQTRSTGNFDGIAVSGGFEVEVKIGATTSLVIEADDNIMKYIETSNVGSTLKIYTEGLHNYSNVHMKVYITTPSLKKVSTSASAEVTVENVLTNTDRLVFKASSGSAIRAEVNSPDISSEASSGSTITLNGKTKQYSAKASSGANIKSWDLLSENTTVNVSSGADANVHASVQLNATASSGASVSYHGAANAIKSVSSGGSVDKKD